MVTLEEHFQKSFMELGEVSTAIPTIKFYLAQNLGIIEFLAETAVTVLDKACCENNAIGNLEKFLVVVAFRTVYPMSAGKCCHFGFYFFSTDLICIRITHYERNPPFEMNGTI
jgi:hypothetical protein